MYDYRRGESVLAAFLLGGIVGAVLGLLFSPRSGRENREFVAAKAQEYWGEGKEFYETSRARVAEETDELRVKIDEARGRLREQVDSVSRQAREKVHEVTPAAKEGVSRAAESVKTVAESAEAKAQRALDRLAESTAPSELADASAADVPAVIEPASEMPPAE
jgi:gas vesicle protein